MKKSGSESPQIKKNKNISIRYLFYYYPSTNDFILQEIYVSNIPKQELSPKDRDLLKEIYKKRDINNNI